MEEIIQTWRQTHLHLMLYFSSLINSSSFLWTLRAPAKSDGFLGSGKFQQLYFFRATSVSRKLWVKHFFFGFVREWDLYNFGKPKHMQKFGTQVSRFFGSFWLRCFLFIILTVVEVCGSVWQSQPQPPGRDDRRVASIQCSQPAGLQAPGGLIVELTIKTNNCWRCVILLLFFGRL